MSDKCFGKDTENKYEKYHVRADRLRNVASGSELADVLRDFFDEDNPDIVQERIEEDEIRMQGSIEADGYIVEQVKIESLDDVLDALHPTMEDSYELIAYKKNLSDAAELLNQTFGAQEAYQEKERILNNIYNALIYSEGIREKHKEITGDTEMFALRNIILDSIPDVLNQVSDYDMNYDLLVTAVDNLRNLYVKYEDL